MSDTVSSGVMTLDDYMERFNREGPFEIIDGEIVPMTPNVFEHSFFTRLIFRRLDAFVVEQGLGEVFSETTFVIPELYDSAWVHGSRIPDIAFYSKAKMRQYTDTMQDYHKKPLLLVPDLVVEIVSPSDKYSDIHRKIDKYKADGVRLIWIVDPERKSIAIHTRAQGFSELTGEVMLSGGDVLPGFELALTDIFSE